MILKLWTMNVKIHDISTVNPDHKLYKTQMWIKYCMCNLMIVYSVFHHWSDLVVFCMSIYICRMFHFTILISNFISIKLLMLHEGENIGMTVEIYPWHIYFTRVNQIMKAPINFGSDNYKFTIGNVDWITYSLAATFSQEIYDRKL